MFQLDDRQLAFLDDLMAEYNDLPVDERGVRFVYDCGSGNCRSKCGGTCQAACKSSCTSLFS